MAPPAWTLDQTRILTLNQVKRVLEDLERRSRRYRSTLTNLAVFRLATCCGLRVSEISQLELRDLKLTSQRPHIHVRKGVGKGGKARKVPLWWDAGTLAFPSAVHGPLGPGRGLRVFCGHLQHLGAILREPPGSHESEPTIQAGDQGAWS